LEAVPRLGPLSRFQTTYEELKLVNLKGLNAEMGFQTTYEELKPDKTLYEYLKELFASRLPMRN